MNDPKKPDQEMPRRVSQPDAPETPPVQAPPVPATEYEKEVPHGPSQPVARTGEYGEGNYQATAQYAEGYEEFARHTEPEEALRRARQIDTEDAALQAAERRAKKGVRPSSPSIH